MRKNVVEYRAFKKGNLKMPSHLKPQKDITARLFDHPVLEKLTRSPIWVPQVMYLILISMALGYSYFQLNFSLLIILALALGGFLTWTFVEYIVHRFLYHTESESEWLNKVQFTGHTIHHQHPIDPSRLAMPPLPSGILSGLFFGLFYLLFTLFAFPFWAGFITGYLVYITFHYYQHRIKSPRIKTLKKLWLYHQFHHYVNPYCAFGVSTLLWDYVFGTLPDIKKGKTKKHR